MTKYIKKEMILVGDTLRITKYYYPTGIAVWFNAEGKEPVKVWIGKTDIDFMALNVANNNHKA